MDGIKQVYTSLHKFRQFQASLDKFRQVQTSSDRLRQFKAYQTSLDKFRQVQTSSYKFIQVQTSSDNKFRLFDRFELSENEPKNESKDRKRIDNQHYLQGTSQTWNNVVQSAESLLRVC